MSLHIYYMWGFKPNEKESFFNVTQKIDFGIRKVSECKWHPRPLEIVANESTQ